MLRPGRDCRTIGLLMSALGVLGLLCATALPETRDRSWVAPSAAATGGH